MSRRGPRDVTDGPLRVWVDQDLCTGDGLCVQYAPEVFEFDIDGLAYVKDGAGELLTRPGAAPTCRPPAAGGDRRGQGVPGRLHPRGPRPDDVEVAG